MTRIDIINHLIARFFPDECHYLEIGVSNPLGCFDHIQASHKVGVDPGVEHKANPVKYPYTSDEFFHRLESGKLDIPSSTRWNIVFIDGLHLAPFAFRDLLNSLNHITQPGFVLLHDCNPPTPFHAHSDHAQYMAQPGAWNGSVWKAMYHYRTQPGFRAFTVNTDWGVGIVDTRYLNENPIPPINPWFEYGVLSQSRQESLGLISPAEFLEMYS